MAEATCQYHHAVTVKHGSQGCTGQRTAEPSGPKHTHKKEVTEAVSLSPKSKKAQGNMWETLDVFLWLQRETLVSPDFFRGLRELPRVPQKEGAGAGSAPQGAQTPVQRPRAQSW